MGHRNSVGKVQSYRQCLRCWQQPLKFCSKLVSVIASVVDVVRTLEMLLQSTP